MKNISPLRYSGGKSRLYKQISQYFPKDKNIMLDLFFGGGSVGLNWLTENQNHELIANDIDNNLINFWETVKNKVNHLLFWKELINDESLTKHIFNNSKLYPSWISFLVKNKCSFNGLNEKGTWSNRAFKENFNQSTFTRLSKCSNLIQRTIFYNYDYRTLIPILNKEIFIYLDPPYLIPNVKKLYKHGDFNHNELSEILKNIKTKWVLSINDCSEIRDWYKDFNIYEINITYTSSNTNKNKCKKVKELVITNFKKD